MGQKLIIKGEEKLYLGVLCAVSADNLASLALGGFKESCAAYRMCRQCMVTRDSAKTKVSGYICSKLFPIWYLKYTISMVKIYLQSQQRVNS